MPGSLARSGPTGKVGRPEFSVAGGVTRKQAKNQPVFTVGGLAKFETCPFGGAGKNSLARGDAEP
jgi:hypothetical protein